MGLKSMFAVRLALSFTLLSFTSAQSSTTSSSQTTASSSSSTTSAAASSSTSTSATSSQPITHTVSVGYAGFTFSPNVVLANPGDTVEFDFYPTNHSVVRAEYGYPCVPYEDTGVDLVGFFSGFEPVDAILSDPPKYSIKVNDSNPIFFYCSAPDSCIEWGMVGGINPNATQTVAEQQQLAEKASFMLQPGEPWPSESSPNPESTSSTGAGSAATSASTAPAAASTSSASSHGGGGISGGAIAGIVIGVIVVIVLLGALFFLFGRNRALSEMMHRRRHGHPDHESDGRGSGLAGTYHAQPKHASGMTMMQRPEGDMLYPPGSGQTSPHLPQYAHMYSGEPSPSLRGPSDMTSPMSPPTMPRSPSPTQHVPAYSALPPELPPEEPKGPHELYAPGGETFASTDPPKKNPGADHYA